MAPASLRSQTTGRRANIIACATLALWRLGTQPDAQLHNGLSTYSSCTVRSCAAIPSPRDPETKWALWVYKAPAHEPVILRAWSSASGRDGLSDEPDQRIALRLGTWYPPSYRCATVPEAEKGCRLRLALGPKTPSSLQFSSVPFVSSALCDKLGFLSLSLLRKGGTTNPTIRPSEFCESLGIRLVDVKV